MSAHPTPAHDAALLELRGLRRSFGLRRGLFARQTATLAAVDAVDLCIRPGEVLGLAGESGSGKSTLARLACQLIEPDAGAILLDGRPLAGMGRGQRREARRRIQIVLQDPSASLSPRRTIRQSLIEPLRRFDICPAAERESTVVRALAAVGLDATALDRLPHQFSSGQRQRISIARALVVGPDLLIADEPVSSLDVSTQAHILQLLGQLRDTLGIAILFISHDLAVIRHLADSVAVMFAGRVVERGRTEDVFTHPAHPYTRQLLAAAPDPDPSHPRPETPPPAGLRRGGRAAGCAFAWRCPMAMDDCATNPPAEHPAAGKTSHRVECHLYRETPVSG